MKWTSHKMLTGAVIFAITGNPFIAMLSAGGSIIPDAIEGFPSKKNYDSWRRNHRQLSHWFLPYLLIFCVSYSFAAFHGFRSIGLNHIMPLFMNQNLTSAMAFTLFIISFLSLGAVFHIAEDSICGKVPGIIRKERFGVKLFNVGSFKEYILVFPLSLILIWTRLYIL